MRTTKASYFSMVRIGFAVFLAALLAGTSACQLTGGGVRIDNDDLGGVVTSAEGPEAGVWVIAETTDLPTKFVKIVVTDDQGRYVLPDLPEASYSLWVRGYGLVDSPKVQATPGNIVNLTAVVAPNPAAAAEYYPANYWYSLLHVPDKSEFPGTGPNGNGISESMQSQAQWLRYVKTDGCVTCHQMGNKATRELSPALGDFDSTVAAWNRRLQSGQAGGNMMNRVGQMGRERALELFADWTDRIAAGELPPAPPRPQGVERNVVVTLWDWATPTEYFHDEISTDKWNPTVNANGPIYGVHEHSSNSLSVLDPVTHTASQLTIPVRDPETPISSARTMLQPSPYWGDELIWNGQANAHNPMFDHKGRVWLTSKVRPNDNPAFCKEGSSHPSAKHFPTTSTGRNLAMYDPQSGEFTLVSTCFSTHHLFFANDDNHTLWTSGGREVVGWLNTKMFDETGDEEKSQGWTPLILDTNGNGKQDAWVEPDQPVDPSKDKRIVSGFYGVMPSPLDDSIWGSSLGFPGAVVRLSPGSNPPETALAEIYELPWDNPDAAVQGFSPRGMDVDRDGVVWAPLASGHFASFDRRKCTGPLNGPDATGQHCPEGWTLYPFPGPQMQGVTDSGSAEASYYSWVDQFDTFGLGANVPIATGNQHGALLPLVDGEFVVLRVPYPLGFYGKGLDGRIDDPNAGWKGKGLWSTWATRAPFHSEGGKGTKSKVVHFQLRPDPLAR
ncbi:MAG: carboxypeptidase regulatory-like domain-containing protein [Acidobacteria bacterium]|nr:carboxypeptidase regulatory-like domain-containing protein [Acidobacteriota bacterium]